MLKDLKACRLSCVSLRRYPQVFKFYTGVTVETFENVKTLVGTAPERMDYSGKKEGEHKGKDRERTPRKLPLEDEILLTLVK